MSEENRNRSVYIFHGTNLLAPGTVPDDKIIFGAGSGAAGFFPGAEITAVPTLDCSETIDCILLDESAALPPGWRALPIRSFIPLAEESSCRNHPVWDILRAYHIIQWRKESVFCGRCGAANRDCPDDISRICPQCGRIEFPRISPAVIVLIYDDRNRILLANNRKFLNGMYSLIAGFVEAGECLESTVAREAKEEVGIDLDDIQYITSQPWPFPNSLMIGFKARYTGGTVKPDGVEIHDAQWFPGDKLPTIPKKGAIARRIIDQWLSGQGLSYTEDLS
ncbi:NAD(+) diphosphatase [Breznakiella homolactica]|uniref:NAD(+) diphosphatase n=1 Tax=Breznakiella homolactica TaxID=2798577 RepID=A0A7T7XLB7_9SPIR|nr:NAD(+) diphosphatase [Breznakiella homolactica]QQO08363.1 NAD(+) diphosphatase [Breznakiella homolactica]